jgi:hypothetical protein
LEVNVEYKDWMNVLRAISNQKRRHIRKETELPRKVQHLKESFSGLMDRPNAVCWLSMSNKVAELVEASFGLFLDLCQKLYDIDKALQEAATT